MAQKTVIVIGSPVDGWEMFSREISEAVVSWTQTETSGPGDDYVCAYVFQFDREVPAAWLPEIREALDAQTVVLASPERTTAQLREAYAARKRPEL